MVWTTKLQVLEALPSIINGLTLFLEEIGEAVSHCSGPMMWVIGIEKYLSHVIPREDTPRLELVKPYPCFVLERELKKSKLHFTN